MARALDRTDPLPLWAQVLADLDRRLRSGEFASRFPTDTQLMVEYGVSRPTVREAIRTLSQRGVVVRERGQLSVVAPEGTAHHAGTAERLLAAADVRRSSHTEVLSVKTVRDASAAAKLALAVTTRFLRITQVHYADGHSIAHETIWIAPDVVRGSDAETTSSSASDIARLLNRALVDTDATTETISAEPAGSDVARALHLDDASDRSNGSNGNPSTGGSGGTGVLIVVNWIARRKGRVVMLRSSRIPAERFSLSTSWSAERPKSVLFDAEAITGTSASELTAAAIRAHKHWRAHLASAIAAGEHLDPARIASDAECELGRWLSDVPAEFVRRPQLDQIRDEHVGFHRAAADAVTVANDGDLAKSLRMLMKGAVARHSNALTAALTQLGEPSPNARARLANDDRQLD